MSLTIKPVPLLEEIKCLWWIEQLSDIILANPIDCKFGGLFQSITLINSMNKVSSIGIMSVDNIIYDNKVILRKGAFLKHHSKFNDFEMSGLSIEDFFSSWKTTVLLKGDVFKFKISILSLSMTHFENGLSFNSTLLKPFSYIVVKIKENRTNILLK